MRHCLGRLGALFFFSLDSLQQLLQSDFLVICPTCQPVRSWLNFLVSLSIIFMFVTELTSQSPMG